MIQQTALVELVVWHKSKITELQNIDKRAEFDEDRILIQTEINIHKQCIVAIKDLLPKERNQMEDMYNNHYALSPLSGKQFFDTNYTQE